jgi:hypothetical protein
MKKLKKQNPTTKAAMFAGAAAMMALAPQTHAQSADALIDKLVNKGILTVQEAQDLRDESDKNFTTAFQTKTGMPDWVTGYKISGDFRARIDEQSADNALFVDRTQFRLRLRAGLTVSMVDNLEAGFRLGTGSAVGATSGGKTSGGPVSNNTTYGANGSKKPIWLDTAYGKWTPVNAGPWMVSMTLGKMDNPFRFSPMVFDPDYTPEGAAFQMLDRFNDQHTLVFNAGAFALDELQFSSLDPYCYGAQVFLDSVWSPKVESSVGVGIMNIVNGGSLTNGVGTQDLNAGNTRAAGVLTHAYNPVIADASVTYKLDSFPFYTGAFPIKLAAEVMENPAVNQRNKGYWAGVTFGKSGTKRTWDLTYRYEYLEADAWYEEMVDDDMGAIYTSGIAPVPKFIGGTNVKGHMVKFNYSLSDALTFTATCLVSKLIDSNITAAGTAGANPNNEAMHLMADLSWKF